MPFALTFARVLAVSATLALAACDNAEERAEKHYQEGLTLLEAGDVDRALVEFRNVFKLNELHREARRAYAEVERDRGNLRAAYGQYLRLVEQYPDDFEARKALLEMAIPEGNWPEIERHLTLAADRGPRTRWCVSGGWCSTIAMRSKARTWRRPPSSPARLKPCRRRCRKARSCRTC